MLRPARPGPNCLQRAAVAVVMGLVSACICRAILKNLGMSAADFNWHLRSACDLLAHRDRYACPFNGTVPCALPARIPTAWAEVERWAVMWICFPMVEIILLRRERGGQGEAQP